MSEVNIPLLRKAVEWAEAEAAKPVRHSQWYQADTVIPAKVINRSPECGTCYCIAGFVAMTITGREDPYEVVVGGVMPLAAKELGIEGDGLALFDFSNTIADVRRIAEELAGERL